MGLPDIIADALEAPSLAEVTDPTAYMFRAFAEQTKSDLRALAACMRGSRQTLEPRRSSRRIAVPVLVAVGTKDPIAGSPGGTRRPHSRCAGACRSPTAITCWRSATGLFKAGVLEFLGATAVRAMAIALANGLCLVSAIGLICRPMAQDFGALGFGRKRSPNMIEGVRSSPLSGETIRWRSNRPSRPSTRVDPVWARIRREAEDSVRREPELADLHLFDHSASRHAGGGRSSIGWPSGSTIRRCLAN